MPCGLRTANVRPGPARRGVASIGDGGGLRRRQGGAGRHHVGVRGRGARGRRRDRQRLRRRRAGPPLRRRRARARPRRSSDGSGEHTLATLDADGTGAAVVVFTAYATDRGQAPAARGRSEVVEKPDLELLARRAGAPSGRSLADAPVQADRRAASREVEQSPQAVALARRRVARTRTSPTRSSAWRPATPSSPSPSWVSTALETDVGPLLAADCRLAVAGDPSRRAPRPGPAPRGPRGARLRRPDPRRRRASRGRGVVAPRPPACSRAACPGEVKGAASRVDAIGRRATPSPGRSARCSAAALGSPAVRQRLVVSVRPAGRRRTGSMCATRRVGRLPRHEVAAALEAVRAVVVGEHDRRHLVERRVDDVVRRPEQQQGSHGLVPRRAGAGPLCLAGSNTLSYPPKDARSLAASPKGSVWKSICGVPP